MNGAKTKTSLWAMAHVLVLYAAVHGYFYPYRPSVELTDLLLPQGTVIGFSADTDSLLMQLDKAVWWEDFLLTSEGERLENTLRKIKEFQTQQQLSDTLAFAWFAENSPSDWTVVFSGSLGSESLPMLKTDQRRGVPFYRFGKYVCFHYEGKVMLASSLSIAERALRHADEKTLFSFLDRMTFPETETWLGLNRWQLLSQNLSGYPFSFFQPQFDNSSFSLISNEMGLGDQEGFFARLSGKKGNYWQSWTIHPSDTLKLSYQEITPVEIEEVKNEALSVPALNQFLQHPSTKKLELPKAPFNDSTLFVRDWKGEIVRSISLPFKREKSQLFAFPDSVDNVNQIFQLSPEGYFRSWQNTPVPSMAADWKIGWQDEPAFGEVVGNPFLALFKGKYVFGWATQNGTVQCLNYQGKPLSGFPLRFNEKIKEAVFSPTQQQFLLLTKLNELIKIDLKGKVTFRKKLFEELPSSIHFAGNTIAEAFSDGMLRVFNQEGNLKWSHDFSPKSPASFQWVSNRHLPDLFIIHDKVTFETLIVDLSNQSLYHKAVPFGFRVLAKKEENERVVLLGKKSDCKAWLKVIVLFSGMRGSEERQGF